MTLLCAAMIINKHMEPSPVQEIELVGIPLGRICLLCIPAHSWLDSVPDVTWLLLNST